MATSKSYLPPNNRIYRVINIPPVITAAATGLPTFRILRTDILDPYEKPKSKAVIQASTLTAAAAGDSFTGSDRKAAKISIAPGSAEAFADLADLLDSLPKDAEMKKHKPKIKTGPTQDRVDEEKKNVKVDAWLYAASRENDNDFHIILGRDPDDTPRRYLNAEVSGLPSSGSSAFSKLKTVRKSFSNIVQDLPGLGYDFYDPPIPVTVQGSIFWDATHASGSKPGPSSVKPKTIWEIHPITSMTPRTA
jgi:hypothetical protein